MFVFKNPIIMNGGQVETVCTVKSNNYNPEESKVTYFPQEL